MLFSSLLCQVHRHVFKKPQNMLLEERLSLTVVVNRNARWNVRKKEWMELVYLKDRMWCIYIHHRVWICYPNVVRRYEAWVHYGCRGGLTCACQEVGKHVVLPLTQMLFIRRSNEKVLLYTLPMTTCQRETTPVLGVFQGVLCPARHPPRPPDFHVYRLPFLP